MATFRERKSADGKVSHQAQVRLAGFPQITATFERKTDARRWAADKESEMRNGRYFDSSQSIKRTVGEMIDRYLTEVAPTKPKAVRDLKSQLNWWRQEYGAFSLAEFGSSQIASARDRLLAGTTVRGKQRSSGTVLRYLATLSTVFTTAVREWEWLERSPMERVSKPKPSRARVRYLSDEERGNLLEACRRSANPYLYTVVVVAISTGMRLGEIVGLRWERLSLNVQEGLGSALLEETKNGDRRVVALAGPALLLLQQHKSNVASQTGIHPVHVKGLVFPSLKLDREEPMDLRTPWETALKTSGVTNFRFHDLRHSAASYLAMNGATALEIAEVLGHRQLQMVKRYAHLAHSHTAALVQRMNSRIFQDENPIETEKFDSQ